MSEFFFSWLIVAASLLGLFYIYSKMAFFKAIYKTSILESGELKEMIDEDRVTIELYEFEISRHINNVDYLQKEIVETQTYLKEIRNKNTRLRNEVSAANDKIAEMKQRLDAIF